MCRRTRPILFIVSLRYRIDEEKGQTNENKIKVKMLSYFRVNKDTQGTVFRVTKRKGKKSKKAKTRQN